jgi:hypothetical protein
MTHKSVNKFSTHMQATYFLLRDAMIRVRTEATVKLGDLFGVN